jgi:hypothetical protein
VRRLFSKRFFHVFYSHYSRQFEHERFAYQIAGLKAAATKPDARDREAISLLKSKRSCDPKAERGVDSRYPVIGHDTPSAG